MKRIVCMVIGHRWGPDPVSKEAYPVMLCRRCAKRRELSEALVSPNWSARSRGRQAWKG